MKLNTPHMNLMLCVVLGGVLIVLITAASGPKAGPDLQIFSAALVAVIGFGIVSLYQVVFHDPTSAENRSPSDDSIQPATKTTIRDSDNGQHLPRMTDLANTHRRAPDGTLVKMGDRHSEPQRSEGQRSTNSRQTSSTGTEEFLRMIYYVVCILGGLAWCAYQFWMATLGWMK